MKLELLHVTPVLTGLRPSGSQLFDAYYESWEILRDCHDRNC